MKLRTLFLVSLFSTLAAGSARAQGAAPTAPTTEATPPLPPPNAPSGAGDTTGEETTEPAPQPPARRPSRSAARPTSTAPEETSAPSDDAEKAPEGVATGFMMQARLTQSIAPLTLNGSASTRLWYGGGAPVVSLGHRGARSAFGIGPTIARYEYDASATTSSSLTLLGLAAHFEADAVQSEDRKNEGYFLGGFSFALPTTTSASGSDVDDGVSGKVAYSLFAGFGARHWATPHLGISVENGESLTSMPIGRQTTGSPYSGLTTSAGADLRASVLNTFGTLGVTIVL
jgi:hypothetical protein